MAIKIAGRFEVPKSVRDFESFRKWARSPDCPEKARVAYFNDTLWIDPVMEQFYVHNQVKGEIAAVLMPLVRSTGSGRYGTDGMLISNPDVQLSTVPDGFYFSFDSFRSGRIREVAGTKNGCIEFEGAPDMVVEVVSQSSETKDLLDLRDLYCKSGVQEYWIVDARTDQVTIEILQRTENGYMTGKKLPGGWLRSEVFRRMFRLVRGEDAIGKPTFTLETK